MIKIGIADDHAMVRSSLRQFIEDQADLRVVGEAATGRGAIELVGSMAMDVLVLDLSMPGQNGMDALADIRACAPEVGVLVLSGYPEGSHALQLIENGARCYLNKECDPLDILEAIRAIAQGQRYLTPEVRQLMQSSRAGVPHRDGHDGKDGLASGS